MSSPVTPIRLHRMKLSGHCHRVELFLSLLGLPYETVDVDLAAGAHRQPAFLARNPFGQVPVIEDGALTLADSNAILVYLALRHAPGTWLPADPLGGEPPSPLDIPKGCAFHPRCPDVMPACRDALPKDRFVGSCKVACHLYDDQTTNSEQERKRIHA